MADDDYGYLVEVIGFNETERLMLSSIFGLAARRDPSFAQRPAGAPRAPDLYLADASDAASIAQLKSARAAQPAPVVLVGDSDHGTGLPLLARPIQWARLLQSFDNALQDAQQRKAGATGSAGAPVDYEKTMVFQRTSTGVGVRPGVTHPGGGTATTPRPAASRPGAAPARPAPVRVAADAVLVVDDNATVRKFMEARLAPFGFNVDFAETGEQAVGLTGTREYTCVFLDVVLPGIDGYQVCKMIKGNKQAIKRTAVVMLTSRTSPFDKLRGSLAGCDEYLTKPVDENRLLEVIAKFIPSSRGGA